MIRQITVNTRGPGLTDCTDAVQAQVRDAGLDEGLCTVFIQHTSASLLIQEERRPIGTARPGALARPVGAGK